MLLHQLGDNKAALENSEEALAFAISNNLYRSIAFALSNIGSSHLAMAHYDLAIEYSTKALLAANQDEVYFRIHQLVSLAECYILIGEFESAEQYITEAASLNMQEGRSELTNILRFQAKIKMSRNDPEGISILHSALERMHATLDFENIEETLCDLWKYYKHIGDFEHALQYHEEYLKVIQSANEEKKQALARVESERREQDKKILQLELHQKQTKLHHQERELTLTASQLATQADLLSHFRNDLRKIVREMGDPIDALKHIKQKLKDLPCEQIDWAKFESEFITVHPEFRQTLHERYPDLTAQETKMCILARIGLKNAEIARLLCLSERSVENHRFNLRKKLGLKTEQNLTQFLAAIK
jgi:tetratricopeptide (TPR) repeat protein